MALRIKGIKVSGKTRWRYAEGGVATPEGQWILAAGRWNDSGKWNDLARWIDDPTAVLATANS